MPSSIPPDHASGEENQKANLCVFLSYGRADAKGLADRLRADLHAAGYAVWQDTQEIKSGTPWHSEIEAGLRSCQLVIALLSPHSVRSSTIAGSDYSVCLDEWSYAQFELRRPIIPVLAQACPPPLFLHRLDYVDLCKWRDSESQYSQGFARLLEALHNAKDGRVLFRKWDSALRPLDCSAFLHDKRRSFVGRKWLFGQIDNWLLTRPKERVLLIKGNPGVGKSAIIAAMAHQDPRVIGCHCCMADNRQTTTPSVFIRSLAAMFAARIVEFASMLDQPEVQAALSEATIASDPIQAFDSGLLRPLHQVSFFDQPGVLLIDALDESLNGKEGGYSITDILAARSEQLPGWLRIVATTRNEPRVLERLSGLRACEMDAEDPENIEDLGLYISTRLSAPEMQSQISESGSTESSVTATLLAKSAGNFLYVRQALDGIERAEYGIDQLAQLPPGLFGLYHRFFARHFPIKENEHGDEVAEGFDDYGRILEVIVAAAEPLTFHQIESATGLSGRVIQKALRRMAAYLPAVTTEEGVRISVFHKSLSDWLTATELQSSPYSIDLRRGHEGLMNSLRIEYQVARQELNRPALGVDEPTETGPLAISVYCVNHLPFHLIQCQRWQELFLLMTDLAFLETKVRHKRVFELLGDLDAAVANIPSRVSTSKLLAVIAEAFRRDVHFIARRSPQYPQALFQSLWNSCCWVDSEDAQDHYTGHIESTNPAHQLIGDVVSPVWALMQSWRSQRSVWAGDFVWMRSLRPPDIRLGSGQLAVLTGHEGGIRSLSFSSDGRYLASGSGDSTIRVWELESGREVARLSGHAGNVESVSFCPSNRYLASGSLDGSIRIWGTRNWECERVLEGDHGSITCVAWRPKGDGILSSAADGTVQCWSSITWLPEFVMEGHEGWVWCVAVSPCGKWAVSGGDDKVIRVWDLTSTGTLISELRGHTGWIRSIVISINGLIASASHDMTVRLWDKELESKTLLLAGHNHAVRGICFSPDGSRILSGSHDRSARIWDVKSGKQLVCLPLNEQYLRCVAWSADGRRLAVGTFSVRVFDARRIVNQPQLSNHAKWIDAIAVSNDGSSVATCSKDGLIRIWDSKSGLPIREWHEDEHWISELQFSGDDESLVAQTGDGTTVSWSVADGQRKELATEVMTAEWAQLSASMSLIRLDVNKLDTEITVEGQMSQARCWIPERFTTIPNRHPVDFLVTGSVSARFYAYRLERESIEQ